MIATWVLGHRSGHTSATSRAAKDSVSVSQSGTRIICLIQAKLDMAYSIGPGKLVSHMQNLSYTYAKYLICIGLGPNILSVI